MFRLREKEVESAVVWYESNRFWGALATAIGIVLVVVAAMKHDLRFLLLFAIPFAMIAGWTITSIFANKKARVILTGIGAGIVCIGLIRLNVWLRPQPGLVLRTKPETEKLRIVGTPADVSIEVGRRTFGMMYPRDMTIWVVNKGPESIHLTGCYGARNYEAAWFALKNLDVVKDFEDTVWSDFVEFHSRRQSYGSLPGNSMVTLNFVGNSLVPPDRNVPPESYQEYFVGVLEYSDSFGEHQIEHCSYINLKDLRAVPCRSHNGPSRLTAICGP